jgi:hypothetical protein
MKASQEDTMQGKQKRRRFLGLVFGGLLYTKMLRNIIRPVMYAKELGSHPEEMICL